MSQEQIIKPHLSYAEAGEHGRHHDSLASHKRREEEAKNMLWEWRTDKVEYYEKRTGYVEGDRFVPYELEALEEVRAELRGMCE